MKKLISWIGEELYDTKIYAFVFCCLVINFCWCLVVLVVIEIGMGVKIAPVTDHSIPMLTLTFPLLLILGALVEEIFFRIIPLTIVVEKWGKSEITPIISCVSSVLFGIAHGGFVYVFIRGFAGLLYSVIFLKCGGMNGDYLKGLMWSSTAHFAWNASLCVLLLLAGHTHL